MSHESKRIILGREEEGTRISQTMTSGEVPMSPYNEDFHLDKMVSKYS
jgi:hypothetical protein